MAIWIRTRERDHRDYEYIAANTDEDVAWLKIFHKTGPYVFLACGWWGGACEFDVYRVLNRDPPKTERIEPWELRLDKAFLNVLKERNV